MFFIDGERRIEPQFMHSRHHALQTLLGSQSWLVVGSSPSAPRPDSWRTCYAFESSGLSNSRCILAL